MIGKEEEPDLNRLDDDELEREEKRDSLRETREERQLVRDRAEQEKRRRRIEDDTQIVFVGLVVFAACAVLGTVAVGLAESNVDLVHFGLVALCLLCGGIYKLLRGRRRGGT